MTRDSLQAVNQSSPWDPEQYSRFAREREQPFWDLCGLLQPVSSPRVVDLGCGDGRLTSELHQRLGASNTLGIDSSETMLERARAHARDGLGFVLGDLTTWRGRDIDVIVSNAALQWAPGHRDILAEWRRALAAGGQLALQMPTNADHPSHRIAAELAKEWLGSAAPPDPVVEHVRPPEWYAQLLYDLGFQHQHVRLQVYGHLLQSSEQVVEWTKGTSLTRIRSVLDGQDFDRFVDEYRRRLVEALGDKRPYFYAFKRILAWGRLPE